MAESNIQLPPDGLGKKFRTVVVDTDKHQEVVVVSDANGNLLSPLTNTELRATPVPVSGVVEISNDSGAAISVSVSGTAAATQSGTWTVALDATSLAALEAIDVRQSGAWTVALDSATLAALETTTVSLDSASLAALESITADVSDRSGRLLGHVTVDNFPTSVEVSNDSGNPLPTNTLNSLIPVAYDYISNTYTGVDLTQVIYKVGGSGGTTVATLTMTYSLGVLQTVTRT